MTVVGRLGGGPSESLFRFSDSLGFFNYDVAPPLLGSPAANATGAVGSAEGRRRRGEEKTVETREAEKG